MSTSSPADAASLRTIPMLSGLDAETYSYIAEKSLRVNVDKGEILFHHGDPSVGFYYVSHGTMELVVSGPDGTSKVVEVVGEGETFGEAVVFLGRPYPVTALAEQDSELTFIPSETMTQLLDTNPTVTRTILANMAVRLHQMVNDLESYTLNSATSRVAKYLLNLVPGDALGWPATIELATSKQVIASRLNLSPATFSRSLRRLSQAGAISVQGRSITIADPSGMAVDPRWQS